MGKKSSIQLTREKLKDENKENQHQIIRNVHGQEEKKFYHVEVYRFN